MDVDEEVDGVKMGEIDGMEMEKSDCFSRKSFTSVCQNVGFNSNISVFMFDILAASLAHNSTKAFERFSGFSDHLWKERDTS